MRTHNLPRPSCIAFIVLALSFVHAQLADADSLINGGVVSGAISVPGEKDSYTFTATVGESVQLRVADLSNNTFYPIITLYGPSGNYITYGTGQTVGAITYTATVSGAYTVVVADNSSGYAATGNYNLEFKSEYRPQAGGLLSHAPLKGALEATFLIRRFLFSNILLHTLQLEAHRRHCIAPRPEVFSHEVPVLLLDAPRDSQSTLPLEKADH
jgi:hypothetical protein